MTTDKRARTLAVDAQGRIATISRVPEDGAASNIKVAAFSPDGTPLWTREISGSGNGWDSSAALAFLADGSLAVVGYGRMTGATTGYITARLDASGNVMWVRELTSAGGYAIAEAIETGTDLSIIVSGVGDVGGSADAILTAKYDANGNLLWQRTHAPRATGISHAFGLVVDSNGNVTVCGDPEPSASISISTLIASYDSAGGDRWASELVEAVGSYASALTLGAADQPVLMRVVAEPSNRVRLSAFAADGTTAWTTTATPPDGSNEFGFALATMDDGRIAVTGGRSAGGGQVDLLTMSFDLDGALLWRRALPAAIAGAAYGWSVAAGRGNSILVAATSADGSSSEDAWLLEYSASGSLNWTRTYDDGAREGGYDVLRDGEGSVIVAGTRVSPQSTYSQFVVKYRDDQYHADGFE